MRYLTFTQRYPTFILIVTDSFVSHSQHLAGIASAHELNVFAYGVQRLAITSWLIERNNECLFTCFLYPNSLAAEPGYRSGYLLTSNEVVASLSCADGPRYDYVPEDVKRRVMKIPGNRRVEATLMLPGDCIDPTEFVMDLARPEMFAEGADWDDEGPIMEDRGNQIVKYDDYCK